jgi:hypothetical protein
MWLSNAPALDLLKPAAEDLLQMWPLPRRVNRPGNDAFLTNSAQ